MRLDHIAYRVRDRWAARKFFEDCFSYTFVETFELKFDDGSSCECFAMLPPEHVDGLPLKYGYNNIVRGNWTDVEYHRSPEIFISEGHPGSIVANWVEKNGPGIHHLAYEIHQSDNFDSVIQLYKNYDGIEFLSDPITCHDGSLTQVFTKPHPITGLVYEFIQRHGDKGFCRDSVKELMESTV